VVGLIGELDAATAPDLQELLEDLLLRRHATEIVIDLTALSFLDSSGLKVFLRTARLAVVSLKLRNPDASTRRVLELMGVEHLLE
jgi:anti-anti-sigma factor